MMPIVQIWARKLMKWWNIEVLIIIIIIILDRSRIDETKVTRWLLRATVDSVFLRFLLAVQTAVHMVKPNTDTHYMLKTRQISPWWLRYEWQEPRESIVSACFDTWTDRRGFESIFASEERKREEESVQSFPLTSALTSDVLLNGLPNVITFSRTKFLFCGRPHRACARATCPRSCAMITTRGSSPSLGLIHSCLGSLDSLTRLLALHSLSPTLVAAASPTPRAAAEPDEELAAAVVGALKWGR